MNAENTRATKLLDFQSLPLLRKREGLLSGAKTQRAAIKNLYGFVCKLPLGYSRNDDVPASEVLADGYGQCNTKVTLLCALARGAGIPTRIHAYELHREVQQKRVPVWLVRFMPKTTVFVWPEFYVQGKWIKLQKLVATKPKQWDSCPFDGARYQLEPVSREWIARDLGLWSTPDELFRKHKPTVHGWRTIGWRIIGRAIMNRRVRKFAC